MLVGLVGLAQAERIHSSPSCQGAALCRWNAGARALVLATKVFTPEVNLPSSTLHSLNHLQAKTFGESPEYLVRGLRRSAEITYQFGEGEMV